MINLIYEVNCIPGKNLPKFPFGSYIFKHVCWHFTSLWMPLISRWRPPLVNLCWVLTLKY